LGLKIFGFLKKGFLVLKKNFGPSLGLEKVVLALTWSVLFLKKYVVLFLVL